MARLGYLAKGGVYLGLGILSVMAATGSGGKTTGSKGVWHSIAGSTGGSILLGVLAFGLFGYSLWKLTCSSASRPWR